MSVSIPFSAQPDQVLDAFRRIQEEARRTGQQLKGLGDVNFPGLESARQKLADLQPGFEQLFSKMMRGEAAGALRSGNNNGVYDKDIVSWLGNVSKQFPDQKELVRHLKAVIEQAGRVSQYMPGTSPISPHNPSSPLPNPSSPLSPSSPLPPTFSPIPNPSSTIPGSGLRSWWRWDGLQPPIGHPGAHPWGLPNFPMWGGTLGGGGLPNFPYHPMNLGGGGGMIAPPLPNIMPGGGHEGGGFGMGGMLPMLRGMLPLLGVGTGLAFAGKKIGDATDEAIQMSALRRSVGGTAQEFEEFREIIRKSGDGMALNTREVLEMARAYAQVSGAVGTDAVSSGAGAGMRLARERGLDPSAGVNMMGRATWLGLGKDETASFKKLAEIMAGSGLGRKQGEAAEALIKFTETAGMHQVFNGDEGFRNKYLALVTSGNDGLKNNAVNILGGYDAAVRQGGLAGDAGKNLMYAALNQHGVNDPITMMRMQQRGFFGHLGEDGKGPMIGDVIAKFIRAQGGDKWMQSAKLSGFFGNDIEVANKAFGVMDKYRSDPLKMQAELKKLEEEQKRSDPGYKAAEAQANLERELTTAMQGLIQPITELKTGIFKLTEGVNHIASFLPGWGEAKKLGSEVSSSLPGPLALIGASGAARNLLAMHDLAKKTKAPSGGIYDDPEFMKQLDAEAKKVGIDPAIARALIWKESRGMKNAVSPDGGAVGLTQLRKGAAKDMGITDIQRYSPTANMRAGLGYLKMNIDKNDGSVEAGLHDYHLGPGSYKKGIHVRKDGTGAMTDGLAYAKDVMVTVEVIHKDQNGREIRREEKKGGVIARPTNAPKK